MLLLRFLQLKAIERVKMPRSNLGPGEAAFVNKFNDMPARPPK